MIGVGDVLPRRGAFSVGGVPHTLADWPSDATGNRSLLDSVGTSFGDSNFLLLAAFFSDSPLTLLALRLARLRWPLGFAALVLAYGHPWPTLGCHPGTTACHSAIVHARRAFGFSFFRNW